MPSERALTLAAQLQLPLGNIPVTPLYGDNTLTKELFVVTVTGSAEMRRGTVAIAAETLQTMQPLFHRVIGVLERDVESKQGLLYTPTQLNPEFKRLRVTAVGLGTPEVPMPVSVGDVVVVPTESVQTVLDWTVVNALDIVGIIKP